MFNTLSEINPNQFIFNCNQKNSLPKTPEFSFNSQNPNKCFHYKTLQNILTYSNENCKPLDIHKLI